MSQSSSDWESLPLTLNETPGGPNPTTAVLVIQPPRGIGVIPTDASLILPPEERTYEPTAELITQPIQDFTFPAPEERTNEPTEKPIQDLILTTPEERTYEPTEEPAPEPAEDNPEESPEGQATEEPLILSQVPNTRRRPRDEEQQPGREVPLQRNPPSEPNPGPWPPRARSILIYLENIEILQPDNDVMMEGQFANLDDVINITRRMENGNHVFRVQGPLRPLPRARWPMYVLEIMGQLTSFLRIG